MESLLLRVVESLARQPLATQPEPRQPPESRDWSLQGTSRSSLQLWYLIWSSGGLRVIEFPLTIPLAVMTKMSWLRSPVLSRNSWCKIIWTKGVRRNSPAGFSSSFRRSVHIRSNPEPGEKIGCVAWQPHHTRVTWFHLEPKPFLKSRQHRPDFSLHFSYCDLNEAVRLVILHRRLSELNLQPISSFTLCFKAMIADSLSLFRHSSLKPVSLRQDFNHSTANNSAPFEGTTFAQ